MISPKYHIYFTGDFDFSTVFYQSPAIISTAEAYAQTFICKPLVN